MRMGSTWYSGVGKGGSDSIVVNISLLGFLMWQKSPSKSAGHKHLYLRGSSSVTAQVPSLKQGLVSHTSEAVSR